MFGEQLLVPTRCSGALWVPTLKVEGRSWKLVAVRRWSAAQKWPCRAEAMVFLIARTFARDCARAWSGWASVWVLAVCILIYISCVARKRKHDDQIGDVHYCAAVDSATYLQETGRSLPSRCSCLETSHRQSRRRAQSARCGLRASGSARRDCGRGTRLQVLSAAVAGMCDAVAARVRGNIRTTTRVSPGRQPSVWVRCAMLTAALQDWVGSGGVYAGSLQISTGGSSSWEFALSAGEAGATVGRLADYKCWLPSHRYLKQPDRCAMKQSGDVVWSEGGGILLDPVVVRLPGVSCLYLGGGTERHEASDVHPWKQ